MESGLGIIGGESESAARRIAITIRDIVRLDARDSPIKAMPVRMPKEELRPVNDAITYLIENNQSSLSFLTGAL
jgi:hypothetical protein